MTNTLRWEFSDSGMDLTPGDPVVMAVLNTTPDSFSDGGQFLSVDAAVRHAHGCIAAGAAVIDVGAESTRPGALGVSAQEQIQRAIPVIRALRGCGAALSIDTTSALVARVALDEGAAIVNDTSAGTDDAAMFALLAERGCGAILMHRRVAPAIDSYSDQYHEAPVYDDVVAQVGAYLEERSRSAEAVGVRGASLVIDPGLGFGKSVEQNFELIARLDELVALGRPVLAGASRKSFLGAGVGIADPAARDGLSVNAALACADHGAAIIRVHAVAAHVQALALRREITRARRGSHC